MSSASTVSPISSETQQKLVSFCNELEGKLKRDRDRALTAAIESIQIDSKVVQALNYNTTHPNQNTVDWSYLFECALGVVAEHKATNKTVNEDHWRALRTLLEHMNKQQSTNGLVVVLNSEVMEKLCEHMLKVLSQSDSHKVAQLAAPLAELLRTIFSSPASASLITHEHYVEFFQFYSKIFRSLAGSTSKSSASSSSSKPAARSVKRPRDDFEYDGNDSDDECMDMSNNNGRFSEQSKLLSSSSSLFATVIGLLMNQYPYSLNGFVDHYVFPFFSSYFSLSATVMEQPASRRLLSGLNALLQSHVMSVLSPFRSFSGDFMSAIVNHWPKSAAVKNEFMRFMRTTMHLMDHLPFSPLPLLTSINTASPLYRHMLDELSQEPLFTYVAGSSDDALTLDSATQCFLECAAWVVRTVLSSSTPDAEPEQQTHSITANDSRKRQRIDVETALYSIDSLWSNLTKLAGSAHSTGSGSSSNSTKRAGDSVISLPWLKFLYVFTRKFPSFFSLHSHGLLLVQLIDSITKHSQQSGAGNRTDHKVWSFACLSRLAAISSSLIHGSSFSSASPVASDVITTSSLRRDLSVVSVRLSQVWSALYDLLLRKHVFDERRVVGRCALSLLTVMCNENVAGGSLEQQTRLKVTIKEINWYKQCIHIDRTNLTPSITGSAGSHRKKLGIDLRADGDGKSGELTVKTEDGVSNSSSPLLLGVECDVATARFLISYLRSFDFSDVVFVSDASSRSSRDSDEIDLTWNDSGDTGQSNETTFIHRRLLQWICSYRFGSALFSTSHHEAEQMFSTSLLFAQCICALNGINGVDRGSELFSPELTSIPDEIVLSQPLFNRIAADMSSVDIHSRESVEEYLIEAQFAPLLPPAQLSTASKSLHPARTTRRFNSASRHLHGVTVTILRDTITDLQSHIQQRLRPPTPITKSSTLSRSSLSSSSVPAVPRSDDLQYSCRYMLHYTHLILHLLHTSGGLSSTPPSVASFPSSDPAATANFNSAALYGMTAEHRQALYDLLSVCLKSLSALLPLLAPADYKDDIGASRRLFSYLERLLKQYADVLTTTQQQPRRVHASLGPVISMLTTALLTMLLRNLPLATPATSAAGPSSSIVRPAVAKAKAAVDDWFDEDFATPLSSSTQSSDVAIIEEYTAASRVSSAGGVNAKWVHALLSSLETISEWRVTLPTPLHAELSNYVQALVTSKAPAIPVCDVLFRLCHLLLVHSVNVNAGSGAEYVDSDALIKYVTYAVNELKRVESNAFSRTAATRESTYIHDTRFRVLGFFLQLASSVVAERIIIDPEALRNKVQPLFEKMFECVLGAMNSNASLPGGTSNPGISYTRTARLLKSACTLAGIESSLTSSWQLSVGLSSDLNADDFVVRLFASTQVKKLLSVVDSEPFVHIYTSFETKCLETLRKMKLKRMTTTIAAAMSNQEQPVEEYESQEDTLITTLACLAAMGTVKPQCERTVLFHFCELWSNRPTARPAIAHVYKHMSLSLGYLSANDSAHSTSSSHASLFTTASSSLMGDHFDYLIMQWLSKPSLSLSQFPYELLMAPSASSPPTFHSFLRSYQSRIIAALVLTHATRVNDIRLMSDTLKSDTGDLVKNNFPTVCAAFYSLYSQKESDVAVTAAKACLIFIQTAMTEAKFNRYYFSRLSDTLCAFIDLHVEAPSNSLCAAYTLDHMNITFQQLSKTEGASISLFLTRHSSDRALALLFHIRHRLTNEFRIERQLRLFDVFHRLCCEWFGDRLALPFIFRTVIDTCIWLLNEFDERFAVHDASPPHHQAVHRVDRMGHCARVIGQICERVVTICLRVSSSQPSRSTTPATPTHGSAAAIASGAASGSTVTAAAAHPNADKEPAAMSLPQLARSLRHVISALVAYAQKYDPGNTVDPNAMSDEKSDESDSEQHGKRTEIAVKAITDIIALLPTSFRQDHLFFLPPFPPTESYQTLNATLDIVRGTPSLAEEGQRFLLCFHDGTTDINTLAHSSASGISLVYSALHHLRSQLTIRKEELNILLQPKHVTTIPVASAIAMTTGNKRPTADIQRWLTGYELISSLVNACLQLCGNHTDHSSGATGSVWKALRYAAATCIGEIGAIDPRYANTSDSRLFTGISPAFTTQGGSGVAADGTLIGIAPLTASLSTHVIGGGIQWSPCQIVDVSDDVDAYTRHTHHAALLSWLSELLQTTDTLTAHTAYVTIANGFHNTREPFCAAYLRLPEPLKVYLYPFYAAKLKGALKSQFAPPKLESEHITWDPRNKTAEEWISQLTYFLCVTSVRDVVLQQCGLMCLRVAGFAARVFPLVIYDIISEGKAESAQLIVEHFNELMAMYRDRQTVAAGSMVKSEADGNSPTSSATLNSSTPITSSYLPILFSALQYFRQQHSILTRQPVAFNRATGQPVVKPTDQLAAFIQQYVWLQLDVLCMAHVARSIGAYYTSLIYLEEWNERQYGRLLPNMVEPDIVNEQHQHSVGFFSLTLQSSERMRMLQEQRQANLFQDDLAGGAASTHQRELAVYHRSVLDVYRHLSDPDAMYGVIGTAGQHQSAREELNVSMLLARHEKRWADVLQLGDWVLQDVNKRLTSRSGGSQPSLSSTFANTLHSTPASYSTGHSYAAACAPSSPSSPLSTPALTSTLVHALQQLGCGHILERYVHDLSATGDTAAYQAVSEAHLESAWRASRWDLYVPHTITAATMHDCDMGSGIKRIEFLHDHDDDKLAHGLHAHLFQSLRTLHTLTTTGDIATSQHVFCQELNEARSALLQRLSYAGPENAGLVFPAIVGLQLLADTEKAWHMYAKSPVRLMSTSLANTLSSPAQPLSSSASAALVKDVSTFERVSRQRLLLLKDSFDLVEPALALRGVLLQLAPSPPTASNLSSFSQGREWYIAHLRFVAEFARKTNRYVIGAHAVRDGEIGLTSMSGAIAHYQNGVSLIQRLALRVESAQLSWEQGQTDHAIRTVKQVVKSMENMHITDNANHQQALSSTIDAESISVHVDALCLLSEWLSKSHSESSAVIQKHLETAQRVATESRLGLQQQEYTKACYSFGCFMDRVFKSLWAKQHSTEHESAVRLFEQNSAKLRSLEESLRDPKQLLILTDSKHPGRPQLIAKQNFTHRFRKELKLDQEQLELFDRSVAASLERAVENYALCLRCGDSFDTEVLYRLIALWFNHYRHSPLTDSKHRIITILTTIPSRKFLPLVYQIASRLSLTTEPHLKSEEKHFRETVYELIRTMALQHPYHTLYSIFALANGDKVTRVSQGVEGGVELNQQRITAAKQLLQQLKTHNKYTDLLHSMEKLIHLYIEVGNKSYPRTQVALKLKDCKLMEMRSRELHLLPVPTANVPIRTDCDYSIGTNSSHSKLATISRFEDTFRFANTGINKPLILNIQCTDGTIHRQLLKPSDDLRQDAVMEQLFELVNDLLVQHSETAHIRELKMRTYNVVPLTPGVGLVEWVLNTSSLSDILTHHSEGAHIRHVRPGQVRSYADCLRYMQEAHKNDQSQLLPRFYEICYDFQPVFHRYFLEIFPSPTEWFARRTTYTRSVAVSSMVGYIVGLGDRHIQNILFDTHSAEVIHIDLGVAFDTGKILKTPEIVPFRLTRDMVDAMGVNGVEGSFRRSCEWTMKVLRQKMEMLLTVLEVFVHDPLYKWALSPAKIQQLRPFSPGEEDNTTAPTNTAVDAPTPTTTGRRLNKTVSSAATLPGTTPVELAADRTTTAVEAAERAYQLGMAAIAPTISTDNTGAQRAMLLVKQRLQGMEQKDVLSVSGQVAALIQEATDMEKLGKMYFGWSAWV